MTYAAVNQDRYVRQVTTYSVAGVDLREWLVTGALRSIGRKTRAATTALLTPRTRPAASGPATTLNRGHIGHVLEPAAGRERHT